MTAALNDVEKKKKEVGQSAEQHTAVDLIDDLAADDVLAVTGDVREPSAAVGLVNAALGAYGRLDSVGRQMPEA